MPAPSLPATRDLVLQAFQLAQEQGTISEEQIQKAKQLETLTKAMTTANVLVEGQRLLDEKKVTKEINDLSSAAGTNPDDPRYVLGELASMQRDYAHKLVSNVNALHEIDNASFFDNPLVYIKGKLDRPGIEAGVEYFGKVSLAAGQAAQEINQSVSTGALNLKLTEKTVNDVTMAQELKKFSIAAEQKANQIEKENLAYQATAKAAQMSGNTHVMQAIAQDHAIMLADRQDARAAEGLRMERARYNLAMEEHALRKQDIALQLQDRRKADLTMRAADEAIMSNMDNATETIDRLGLNFSFPKSSLTVSDQDLIDDPQAQRFADSVTKMKYIESLPKDSPLREKFDIVKEIAASISAQKALGITDVKPVFDANSQASSLEKSMVIGARPGTVEEKRVIDFQKSGLDAYRNSDKFDPKASPEAFKANLDTVLNAKVKEMYEDVEKGSENIWGPAKPAVLGTYGQFTTSDFYKKVIEPQIKNGVTELRAKDIIQHALDAAEKGLISSDSVTPIVSTYISEAVHYNNINANYYGRGLGMQQAYNIRDTNPITGEAETYDLFDQGRLSTYVETQRYMRNKKAFQPEHLDTNPLGFWR